MIKQDGFDYSFDEYRCATCEGNCCIGESGYIWVSPTEMVEMAEHLNQELSEFKKQSLDKIGYKYSIKELQISDNSFACKFFDLSKKQCSIYEVRPSQCRTFPFWEYFKTNSEELRQECPAVLF
jgi:Fe-S-cluster containining protein